mgnify:CR=1 FL=1|jgi:hypothetical protein
MNVERVVISTTDVRLLSKLISHGVEFFEFVHGHVVQKDTP